MFTSGKRLLPGNLTAELAYAGWFGGFLLFQNKVPLPIEFYYSTKKFIAF